MTLRLMHNLFRLCCLLMWFVLPQVAAASEYRAHVIFNGLPLPGATVTVSDGTTKLTAVTDILGFFSFLDLKDGTWTIEIQKLLFATIKQTVERLRLFA